MAPRTRSSARSTTGPLEQLPPRTRGVSTSSGSSGSEKEGAAAPRKKRSLRRLVTIELPAAELKARQLETAKTTPPPTTPAPHAPTSAPTTPTTIGAPSSTPPSATPQAWGLSSILTKVRRILSPFPPSKRGLTPISEETPRRVETPSAPPPPPHSTMPSAPSTARKRPASDDDDDDATSTPKRVKQTPSRRTAKSVRKQRDNAIAATSKLPELSHTPTNSHIPLIFTVPEDSDDLSDDMIVPSPNKASSQPSASLEAIAESTASPETAQEISKKRKRIKIDDLKYIPSRRPGQSTGTFALLDEFFIEDEDSVEVDESQLAIISDERPTKKARTANNIFDLTSPQKASSTPTSQKRTRSTSPTKRGNLASPQKSSYLGTPSTLADKVQSPVKDHFPSPEKLSNFIEPSTTEVDKVQSPVKGNCTTPQQTSFLGTPSTLADKIQSPVKVHFADPIQHQAQLFTPAAPTIPHHFDDAFGTPESAKMQSVKKTASAAPVTPPHSASPDAMQSIRKMTPISPASPMDVSSPQITQSMTSTSHGAPTESMQNTPPSPSDVYASSTSPDNQAIDTPCPQGPGQHLDALKRKRSEAEKYKPQKGSRLKEMQRLSSTSTLLDSPQHSAIDEEPTSPTESPPEYLLQAHGHANVPSATPNTAPSFPFFDASAFSYTSQDTPLSSNIFAAPSASPLTKAPISFPPAGSNFDRATFTPVHDSSFTPSGLTPNGSSYTPEPNGSFTPNGPTLERQIFTPRPITSYAPATVSFTPLETPPERSTHFPAATPMTSRVTDQRSRDLIDDSHTASQIAAAALYFSNGVKDFGMFHPLAVA
ncbi:hypothetical protein CAC42_2210 [Sphaceloma murrayae]|uniref:Uncharacterized protein n=1 Tax=Sphaceloma murrayae TaxID=2082308 RepID=A0A2K1QJ52_9PEZI|nr:hypothetical protein CAC42_2210 [Sphaceloma murrayae]